MSDEKIPVPKQQEQREKLKRMQLDMQREVEERRRLQKEEAVKARQEANGNFLCCFPTRSWSGERINQCQVVRKSFDNEGQIFILRLKGSELLVTLTKDLIKSLHTKKVDTYGFIRFMDFENERINGVRVVNKIENGSGFVLNLHGQVEPITLSKDLVESLHAMIFKYTKLKSYDERKHIFKPNIFRTINE